MNRMREGGKITEAKTPEQINEERKNGSLKRSGTDRSKAKIILRSSQGKGIESKVKAAEFASKAEKELRKLEFH